MGVNWGEFNRLSTAERTSAELSKYRVSLEFLVLPLKSWHLLSVNNDTIFNTENGS